VKSVNQDAGPERFLTAVSGPGFLEILGVSHMSAETHACYLSFTKTTPYLDRYRGGKEVKS